MNSVSPHSGREMFPPTTRDRLREAGVNHVAFNLKTSRRPAREVLEELAEHVLPEFPALDGYSDRS